MAIVWGIAIMLAISTCGAVSGVQTKPAMTLAFAFWRRFPRRFLLPDLMAKFVRGFLAAATVFFLFNPYLKARELEKEVGGGAPGSEVTAMCYGEFFPSPGPLTTGTGPTRSLPTRD